MYCCRSHGVPRWIKKWMTHVGSKTASSQSSQESEDRPQGIALAYTQKERETSAQAFTQKERETSAQPTLAISPPPPPKKKQPTCPSICTRLRGIITMLLVPQFLCPVVSSIHYSLWHHGPAHRERHQIVGRLSSEGDIVLPLSHFVLFRNTCSDSK